MRKKLFEELFKVAEERSPSKTRNGVCTYLENAFSEMDNFSFNKETFIRYYKKYVEEKNVSYNPNAELLNRCAQYLGYNNYEDFVLKNKDEKEKEDDEKPPVFIISGSGDGHQKEAYDKSKFQKDDSITKGSFIIWFKKNKKIVIVNIIVLISVVITISTDLLSKNKEKWMIWDENKYVEANFNVTEYYNNKLVPFNQNKIDFFKEIENPDCNTDYFDNKGNPILWYYKVGKGNLELYTSHGFHPENGKPLKHITRYMIQQHICPEY